MRLRSRIFALPISALSLCLISVGHASATDETSQQQGEWSVVTAVDGTSERTRHITIHPQPEAKPSLDFRFVPDPLEQLPGNSAIHYLKSLGFLEQTRAREWVDAFHRAQADAGPRIKSPPYSWIQMTADEFPVAEVKQYLRWHRFQEPLLREARRRTVFSLDRNIGESSNLALTLLPEINGMRNLARIQQLRSRVALLEDRIPDALAVQGQQFTLAYHLGTDEFLVSNLVGAAVARMAFDDTLSIVQHAQSPNLYWALAMLPSPLLSMDKSISLERQFLFEQVKLLRTVDEQVHPAAYWDGQIDELVEQLQPLVSESDIFPPSDTPEAARQAFMEVIAATTSAAKSFLVEQCDRDAATVAQFSPTQAFLLAMQQYYLRTRDDSFKQAYVPHWNLDQALVSDSARNWKAVAAEKLGPVARFVDNMVEAVGKTLLARQRVQQNIAMLQTVESIRDFASVHAGRLPPSLQDLRLPSPADPFTGKLLDYRVVNDTPGVATAFLTGAPAGAVQYRLKLQVAAPVE